MKIKVLIADDNSFIREGMKIILTSFDDFEVVATVGDGEEAVAYCEREGIPYQVFEPKEPVRRTIAYADNFSFQRRGLWTH